MTTVVKRGFITNKVFVPTKYLDERDLRSNYTHELYNEKACEKCENKEYRPNEICQECKAFGGVVQLWERKTVRDSDYYTLPKGFIKRLEKVFDLDLSKLDDKRACPPFTSGLKWTGKLRDGTEQLPGGVTAANQKKLVKDWLNKEYGVIEAPPRTGKTVLACYISCKKQTKTIIIADRKRLLKQFYKTYMEQTNLKELKRQGKNPVVIVENVEDLKSNADVLIVNYQKFIRSVGSKYVNKYLKGRYGMLISDEAHMNAAPAYAKFISALDTKYTLGLTATPSRKDGKFFIVRDLIGPVTSRSQSISLLPRITVWDTKLYYGEYSVWAYAMRAICVDPKRNALILNQIKEDLKEGHTIIIPTVRLQHMKFLVDLINKQFGRNTAAAYWAKCNQKKVLSDLDNGKVKVLVAIMSMIKQGIDMKTPSCLYVVIPTSNKELYYQMTNRVCTPFEGKPTPIVRHMVDNSKLSRGCFRAVFTNEIRPRLQSTNFDTQRYAMSPEQYKLACRLAYDKLRRYEL